MTLTRIEEKTGKTDLTPVRPVRIQHPRMIVLTILLNQLAHSAPL